MTLVAELNITSAQWFNTKGEPAGPVWVAPEAARPWLEAPFQQLLQKNKNTTATLAGSVPCRKYSAALTTSGRRVDGFVCADAARLLVYLTLSARP